jgi:hypothetical protein
MENIKKFVEDMNTAENTKARAMENIAEELTRTIEKLREMGIKLYSDCDYVVNSICVEDGKLYLDSDWDE